MFYKKRIYYIFLTLIFVLGFSLRFYKLSSFPPGIYVDEAAIGIDAYSVLTTGKDQFGVPYPLWFRSLEDYKMPLYIYLTTGSMAIFGKNEFAIRFPSALAGSLTVIVLYFFVKELMMLTEKKFSDSYSLLPAMSSFLLAISSWHIQFSRGGFEVNFGVFLYLLAAWLSLCALRHKRFLYLILGFILLVASNYTYQTFRIISPITLCIISVLVFFKIPRFRKRLVALCGVCIVLFLPIILFSFTPQGTSRYAATSAFAEYPTKNILDKIELYPMIFLKNYLSFFSFDFLFSFGDGIGRHQVPGFGVLFRWELPFFLIGIFTVLKRRKTLFTYILATFIFLTPIPAALARPSPHTLRSLPLVVPFCILIAVGILSAWNSIKVFRSMIVAIFIIAMISEFVFYIHIYYFHSPKINTIDWGGSYKQIVEKAMQYSKKYSRIVVDTNLSDARLYFRYYGPSLHPVFVTTSWQKPKEWGNEKVLFIRPNYGNKNQHEIIEYIYMINVNHDVFAEFWSI